MGVVRFDDALLDLNFLFHGSRLDDGSLAEHPGPVQAADDGRHGEELERPLREPGPAERDAYEAHGRAALGSGAGSGAGAGTFTSERMRATKIASAIHFIAGA